MNRAFAYIKYSHNTACRIALNRAVPELQSKWLEIIRSRKIMGFRTQVKWVWAAMNPIRYSGTQSQREDLGKAPGGLDIAKQRLADAPTNATTTAGSC